MGGYDAVQYKVRWLLRLRYNSCSSWSPPFDNGSPLRGRLGHTVTRWMGTGRVERQKEAWALEELGTATVG